MFTLIASKQLCIGGPSQWNKVKKKKERKENSYKLEKA